MGKYCQRLSPAAAACRQLQVMEAADAACNHIFRLASMQAAKRIQLECEEVRVSRARATDLTPEEAASVAHVPGDNDHVKVRH